MNTTKRAGYSYDALTSNRSYKDALSQDVAVQMIASGMCGVFNERLIDCLMKVVNHSSLVSLRESLYKNRAVVSGSTGFAPERVLCIGNTEYLTKAFLDEAFPGSKVTVVGNTVLGSVDKIKLFRIKKPSVKVIFETYDFDVVVFFSGDLTYQTTEKLAEVIAKNADEIAAATLATAIACADAPEGAYAKDWNINGEKAMLSVVR